jgi:hypothetical protein
MTTAWLASLAISAAFWLVLAGRVQRLRHGGAFLEAAPPSGQNGGKTPFVSILVPARNEARDLPATLRSLRAQDHRAREIIVVDDESEDGTADVARSLLRDSPDARVLAGAPRPDPGWIGKSWALVQAVRAARGDWLLFTDADVEHHPTSLRRALEEAETRGYDVITILPAIECRTLRDRLIMPLFVLLAGTMRASDPGGVRTNEPARLSGAFILIRHSTYRAAGGHESVRGEIVEDMALARRLRALGCPIGLRYTHTLVRTPMYEGWRELWHGMIRFAYPMLGRSLARLTLALAAAFFGVVVPLLALATGSAAALRADPASATMALAGTVLWLLPCALCGDVARLLRLRRVWLLALPIGVVVLAAAAAVSAARYRLGSGIEWKGRRYETREPEASSRPTKGPTSVRRPAFLLAGRRPAVRGAWGKRTRPATADTPAVGPLDGYHAGFRRRKAVARRDLDAGGGAFFVRCRATRQRFDGVSGAGGTKT